MNRKKCIFLLIWLVIATIIFSPNVFAENIEIEDNYSKKYKEWLELSDEEKSKTIPPLPFNVRNKKNDKNNTFYNVLKASLLPSKYDLRDYIDIEVKDQMNTGECWAFSANSVLETYLAKKNKQDYEFSERHMEYETSQSFYDAENPNALFRSAGDGGTCLTAFTYYSRGSGPVLEEDMPFENNENNISINDLPTNVTVKKVDNMYIFPNIYKYIDYDGKIMYMDANGDEYKQSDIKEIRNQIKEHIMNYGGITTSIYGPNNESFYSEANSSMNLNYDLNSNHAVTIIGWDDNYSRDNFIIKPNKNGAYIVLNSWGNEWGDNGIYYVSYEDFLIESNLRAITSISNVNYDDIYQYDLSEMYGTIDTKYAGNVFTAKENEKLTEVMIGTWEEQTCNIYVNSQGSDLTVNNLTKVASSVTLKPGYNTIKIENNINLQKDKQFAIVVERLNEDCIGIGVECYLDDSFSNSISHEGESFVSIDGNNWEDIYDPENMMNLSIKAFTQKDGTNIEIANVKYDGDNCIYSDEASEFVLKFRTTIDFENQTYNVIITNENGSNVTNKFNVTKVQVKDRIGKIVVSSNDNTNIGNFILKINLNNKEINYNFEVKKLLDFDENTYMLIQIPDKIFYEALKCVLNDEQLIYFFDKEQKIIVRKDIEELELIQTVDFMGIFEIETGFGISNLNGIENFTNLKKMKLKDEPIDDLKSLENLTNLIYLEITRDDGLEKIKNLNAINKLTNLEYLNVTNPGNDGERLQIKNEQGKLYINVDREITAQKQAGDRYIEISINGSKISGSTYRYFYSVGDGEKIINFNDDNFGKLIFDNLNDENAVIDYDGKTITTSKSKVGNIESLNIIPGDEINDITGIEELNGLTNLSIEGCQINNLNEIQNLSNLKKLTIIDSKVNNLRFLNDMKKIEKVKLVNTQIVNSSYLLKIPSLEKLEIYEDTELVNNKETIILPDIFESLYDNENCTISAILQMSDDNQKTIQIQRNADNELYVDVDYEVNDEKKSGRRYISISVNGGIASGSKCKYYFEAYDKGIEHVEYDKQKYITTLNISNNTVKEISTEKNFPRAKYLDIKDINGKVLSENDRVGTGTVITLLDDENKEIDTYIVSILGDLDGNGEIDMYDILRLIELVIDTEDDYIWDEALKLAGNCVTIDSDDSENPNLNDILRLIEYYFDGKEWR